MVIAGFFVVHHNTFFVDQPKYKFKIASVIWCGALFFVFCVLVQREMFLFTVWFLVELRCGTWLSCGVVSG